MSGLSQMGRSCLLTALVIGWRRVPDPPANIIPFIKKWLGDSPDETAIVRWNFAKLLREKGFKNVSVFPYDFLHPSVPSFLIPVVNGIGKVVEKIPVLKEIAGSVVIYAEK